MKKSIAIIAALLCLTACTTTDPQLVETAPETDTATAETQQETETETEQETEAAPVSDAQITYADVSGQHRQHLVYGSRRGGEHRHGDDHALQLLDGRGGRIRRARRHHGFGHQRTGVLEPGEIGDKSIVSLQQRHMLDAAEMQQVAEQPEERQPWWRRIGKKT